MRRILIDYARARKRDKRGGERVAVSLDEAMIASPQRIEDLECRCFAGLSVEETAEALGASEATVKRDWAFARAWLNRELGAESS